MRRRDHPAVPGIGVCVSCSAVLCADCATRRQGWNFCSECLDDRVSKGSPSVRAVGPLRPLIAGAAVLGSFALLAAAAFAAGLLLYQKG